MGQLMPEAQGRPAAHNHHPTTQNSVVGDGMTAAVLQSGLDYMPTLMRLTISPLNSRFTRLGL